MSTNTSVGRGPASGGNENRDGDPRNKTMGEKVKQEPPAGNDAAPDDDVEAPVQPDSNDNA
jgi:hypothetical protein